MLKSLKALCLLLLASAVLAGCDSFLSEPPQGVQNTENFFNDVDEATSAVMGAYFASDQGAWWQLDRNRIMGDIASDDAWKGNSIQGDQLLIGEVGRFNWDPTNEMFDNRWRYLYRAIGNANWALEGIQGSSIPEDIKSELMAEARFLRGVNYFKLVKGWGGVPLITEPLPPEEASQTPRASLEETYAQIESDLEASVEDLPLKSERNAQNMGRATRGAAQGFLAKVHLFQEEWEETRQYAETVMNSGEYSLNDDFNEVWQVSNPNGTGSLFELNYSSNQTFATGSGLTVLTRSRADGGWGFDTPTSDLDRAFESRNDPRGQWTIIEQGDTVLDTVLNGFDYSNYDTRPSENMSGRTTRKFFIPPWERPANEMDMSPLNHIELRYADLLLMHAEASYRLGDESAARSSLNEVRARADRLEGGNVPPRTSSGQALLEDIWLERRLELAMEGHRYYDLKRQGRLVEVVSDFVEYNTTESDDPYDAGNDRKSLVAERHYRFPIPQNEIDLAQGALEQNPGY